MLKPAFCDYIAYLIKKSLADTDRKEKVLLDSVGSVRFDFDEDGSMLSTTKFILVVDINGKAYTITIAENAHEHQI